MASLTDYLNTSFPGTPTAWSMMDQVPQYRVNETAGALTQDTGIANQRLRQDYMSRTVPDQMNAAAAQGNFGSSGFGIQVQRGLQDYQRQGQDINRMYYRNMASIAKQRIMGTMGAMF